MNTWRIGGTTSGKTTATAADTVRGIEREEDGVPPAAADTTSQVLGDGTPMAVVVHDPHKDALAWTIYEHLEARGITATRDVLFDRLAYTKRVLGQQFVEGSKAKDEVERRSQNDFTAHAFSDLLARRRGAAGLQRTPLTEEFTLHASTLLVEQDEYVPECVLHYAFRPGTYWFSRLLDHCQHADTVYVFRQIASGKIKRGQYAAAERLIAPVCTTPSFAVRCGQTFDLPAFLGRGGILLVEGGGLGNVSPDAMRTMLGCLALKVIQYVRNRPRPYPRVKLIFDEAINAGLIGFHGAAALAETQKMGLDIEIITQTVTFDSSAIAENVHQNCLRHEWFFCNADIARVAAQDLGDPIYKDQVMQLRPGERIVKEPRRIFKEYVKRLEDLWCFPGLGRAKAEMALEQLRQRPEYQDGRLPTGEPSAAESVSLPPSTPSSSLKFNTSSPALRLRGGG